MNPSPYFVAAGNTTPDEPHPGWYWLESDDDKIYVVHGSYRTKELALLAIASRIKKGEL